MRLLASVGSLALFFALSLPASADEDIAASVATAREAYAAAMQAAQDKFLLTIDSEIKKVAAAGSLELVKSLQQEKASFEADASYEPKAVRLKPTLARYQADVKSARDKLRTALNSAKVAYTKLLKISEAEAVDAEIKAIGTAKPATTASTAPASSTNLKEGIAVLLFARVSTQQGDDGFVEPEKLGKALGEPSVVGSIERWNFNADSNAVAYGYVFIEQPGEYEFRTYNYYDRNALYVAGQLICPYRGSVAGGSEPSGKERITLRKGYAAIVSVGYVDAKGSVDVTWKPPGQKDFSPIPTSLLFHETKDGKPINPLEKK